MEKVFITLSVLFVFGILISENDAQYSIPVPGNVRLQALKGRKCLNLLWNKPCDHPYCKLTLKIKLQRGNPLPSSVESVVSSYKPDITNNNASYIQCIYDRAAGENASCCNSINSGAHLTNDRQESLSNYEKISFNIKICLNDSGNCVSGPEWFDFILPWHNPCFFDRPCQNSGTCSPGVDTYNCSCMNDWIGYNCTSPKGYIYHAKKCLDYSSNADVKQYMKTLAECKTACEDRSSPQCHSFEFQKMSSSNHGNCTLRDSNSLKHSLVACDADLYEDKRFLTGSSGPTVVIVTLHLLIMLLASIFLAEY